MERKQVDTKDIKAVAYDKKEEILEVVFWNNITYRYFNVPKKVYKELVKAECIHRYLNLHIRSVYPYKSLGRVDP